MLIRLFQEILAKYTKLADDKLYTSIVEEPENEDEEEKKGEADLFAEDEAADEDDDKRSY